MGSDDRWGTTRSGYRYERIRAQDLIPEGEEDYFAWTCGEKGCGILIQGGRTALQEHLRIVHPEK